MTEIVFLVEEASEGGYTARALGESIFTQAETWDELEEAVRDAVRCHFDREEDRPRLLRLHYVRDKVLAV
ncbi:MAG: 2-oxoisovalerate dehydrogenase [bacterium]|nr:2-oxoisovalerate dehydrogenase [bacterium]